MLHVDVDAFFASVEQVLNPALMGQPVIVGGRAEDRSVVASASYEARAYGVRVAMPLAAARRLCRDAVFLRGDFDHYNRFSTHVRRVLDRFSPAVEQMSLDDFYVDLAGLERLFGRPVEIAERIKQRVKAETGLNVSMGLAANKVVARVASDYAKPNGIAHVLPGHERAFLRPMSVRKLPGVGPRTAAELEKFNLHTVGDLARIDGALLVRTFGLAGEALSRHANGGGDATIRPAEAPRSISRETTFEQDTDDRRVVGAMLYYLAERAARQLREEHMHARRVSVRLRYADFRTVERSCTLREGTDQDDEFYRAALGLLQRVYTRRMRIRLVGVCLSGLTTFRLRQARLFTEEASRKRRRFYRSLDGIRRRFGFGAATVGPSLFLLHKVPRDERGFRLRTPSLSR